MKKLKLTVDSLRVESFEAAAPREDDGGTVRGFDSMGTLCDIETCAGGGACVSRAGECDGGEA